MNWKAMAIMALILLAACLFASLAMWLQESGVHPRWIIGGLFTAAILVVGVLK